MRETSSKVTLSGVPETMLQTVYARAKETQNRGAVRDEKAVEIIRRLDYDFSLADKDSAMSNGVIARTIVLDRLTGAWLQEHPGGTVVNVACGLDTRCYRMEGYGRWYNLDLPETIAVRQRLLPENGAISPIAMSAMDDWGGEITEQFPRVECKTGKKIFEVKNLHQGRMVRDINFSAYEGEIGGFAGLMGAGRTERRRAIIGVEQKEDG